MPLRYARSKWYRAHAAETQRALAAPYSSAFRSCLTRIEWWHVNEAGDIIAPADNATERKEL